jgi:thiosulfate dehydrogenase
MLKGVLLGIAGTIVVVVCAVYLAISLGLIPASADRRPGNLERWAARTSLNATIARESAGLTNPLQPSDETLLAGVKIYGQSCAVCHGDSTGRPTHIGFGLYQRAPSLGRHGVEDDPVSRTYWMVTHGVRFTGMPSFARTLSDTQRWQVATFLKNMDKLPPKPQALWKKVSAPAVPAELLPRFPPGPGFPGPPGPGN